MAVYCTGDTHGVDGTKIRLSIGSFCEQMSMNMSDRDNNFIIITGDFGCIWDNNPVGMSRVHFEIDRWPGLHGESRHEKLALDILSNKPFTILFCDGNHDNIERLDTYETIDWHGGKVHKIRNNIFHLIRGEIYDIDNKKFFVFGGASSHDISDGIVDIHDYDTFVEYRHAIAKMNQDNKMYRIRDISWWDREMPTISEMNYALDNLKKHDFKIDYVISHDCPIDVLKQYNPNFMHDDLNEFFSDLVNNRNLQFKEWFFGHYHQNLRFENRYTMLYNQIIRII